MSLYKTKIIKFILLYSGFIGFILFLYFKLNTKTFLELLFYYYESFISYYLVHNAAHLSTLSTLSFYFYNIYCFELYLVNIIFLVCVLLFYIFYNSLSALKITNFYHTIVKYNQAILQKNMLYIRKQSQSTQALREPVTRCTGKYIFFKNRKNKNF